MTSEPPSFPDDEPDDFGRRLVRPYAVTRGRTRPTREISIETLVRRCGSGPGDALGIEERAIIDLVERPISVAEIAARRNLVLGVARILVADLVQSGLVETSDGWSSTPNASGSGEGASEPGSQSHRELLERVLNGLQSL